MRLTKMFCDGCGRVPTFWEWAKGELSSDGYQDWRHPGIVFKEAGCPLVYENKGKSGRAFQALFGRPIPEELSYLCPECQSRAELELPGIISSDPGDPVQQQPPPGHYFGR